MAESYKHSKLEREPLCETLVHAQFTIMRVLLLELASKLEFREFLGTLSLVLAVSYFVLVCFMQVPYKAAPYRMIFQARNEANTPASVHQRCIGYWMSYYTFNVTLLWSGSIASDAVVAFRGSEGRGMAP